MGHSYSCFYPIYRIRTPVFPASSHFNFLAALQVPWIKEFVLESGWPAEVAKSLSKVDKIEGVTKNALEDLLVSSGAGNPDFIAEMKELGIIGACQNLKLRELAVLIAKGGVAKRQESSAQ